MFALRALRLPARHHHLRQGHDLRLLPARRDDRHRPAVRAVLQGPRRRSPHGYTFGGHPVSAAVAMANLDIFEREDLNEHVRENERGFRATLEKLLDLPIVGDVRGDGYFYGIELVKDKATKETFDDDESERLLRGFLSKALFEAGLYCRADDRGDPVVQLAPPLICDQARVRRDRADPARRAHARPGSACDADRDVSRSACDVTLPQADAFVPRHRWTATPSVDVCVVGAGFTGLWTALPPAGARPRRCGCWSSRRSTPGFGASGRNGGWCSALFPVSTPWPSRAGTDATPRWTCVVPRSAVDDVGRPGGRRGDRLRLVPRRHGRGRAPRGRVAAGPRTRSPTPRRGASDVVELLDAAPTGEHVQVEGAVGGTFTPDCARCTRASWSPGWPSRPSAAASASSRAPGRCGAARAVAHRPRHGHAARTWSAPPRAYTPAARRCTQREPSRPSTR